MEVIFLVVGAVFTLMGIFCAIEEAGFDGYPGKLLLIGISCFVFIGIMYKTTVYKEEKTVVDISSLKKEEKPFIIGLSKLKDKDKKDDIRYIVAVANPSSFGADILNVKVPQTVIASTVKDSGNTYAIITKTIRTNNQWFHVGSDSEVYSVTLVVREDYAIKPFMEYQ